jgi:hypothetical protein
MTPEVIRSLPREKLLFYVAQLITPEIRKQIRAFVPTLRERRSWLLGAPELVEVIEDLATREGDEPTETLGAEMEVCSSKVPGLVPKDVEAAFYAEVSDVVEAVRELSERTGITFEFMYGDIFVGEIVDGKIDTTLQVGLLDEWRRHLESMQG